MMRESYEQRRLEARSVNLSNLNIGVPLDMSRKKNETGNSQLINYLLTKS